MSEQPDNPTPETPPQEGRQPADAKKQPIEALAKGRNVPDWILAAMKAGKKLEDGHSMTGEEFDALATETSGVTVKGT